MFVKSDRLRGARYEIRGPVYDQARELERQGYRITRLNIGNPAPYGFDTPNEMVHDMIVNIRDAQGYSDSQGLYSARIAIQQMYHSRGIADAHTDSIYLGNGVSELILLCLQALLNPGDEVLVPSPDYPLWTSAIHLCIGKTVHYRCDEASNWYPDLADMKAKITGKTKAIVLINPNNPTGAVYPPEILKEIAQLAEANNLILFADEIYDRILYDGAKHFHAANYVHDTLCITMSGLSKNHRAAGLRAGWAMFTGARHKAISYLEGVHALASMRLCSNVAAQLTIQTALGGKQSIEYLVAPGGRLYQQRELAYNLLMDIPGISCVKPEGAFYLFPKIDLTKTKLRSDLELVMGLLKEKHVLLVQGTGFHWPEPDHFRIVFLPPADVLREAMEKIKQYVVEKAVV
jgi:alanine-synthesizing transaminase